MELGTLYSTVGVLYHMGWGTPYSMVKVPYHMRGGYTLLNGGGTLLHVMYFLTPLGVPNIQWDKSTVYLI